MSNVLYKCPICSARLFAAPGGTKLKCRRHPETLYVQVEEYVGPNFAFVDPDQGKGDSATHVQTHPEAKHIKTVNVQTREELTEEEILDRLRRRYEQLFHVKADLRWGPKRLRNAITVKEEELEEASRASLKGILRSELIPDDEDEEE